MGAWIDNFDDVRATSVAFATKNPRLVGSLHVVDLAEHDVSEQLRLVSAARLIFGAHGDGLSWVVYAGDGAALLEAVPGRSRGFQICSEGLDANPSGIFGGLARLARQTHACWLNPQSQVKPFTTNRDGNTMERFDEEDHFQWNWRQMNLHIDVAKFGYYLGLAADRVWTHRFGATQT